MPRACDKAPNVFTEQRSALVAGLLPSGVRPMRPSSAGPASDSLLPMASIAVPAIAPPSAANGGISSLSKELLPLASITTLHSAQCSVWA